MSPQPRGCFEGSSRHRRPLPTRRFLAHGDFAPARNLKSKSLPPFYLTAMIKTMLTFLLISHTSCYTTLTNNLSQSQVYLKPVMASLSKVPAPKSPENCNLPEDVHEMVVIPNLSEGEEEEITKRMLAGKIITTKNLNRTGIRGAFKQMWENLQEVSILEGGGSTFAFTFQTQEEAKLIWNKSPGFVLNHWMSLQEWGDAEVEDELFRRKKNKKEEWYDADGKLICVMVTTMFGPQTYVVDEWGDLTPSTP